MKKAVVISGVAGMTGSCVAKKLLETGIEVLGFDNFFAGSKKVVGELSRRENFTFFEYDIRSPEEMAALFNFSRTRFPVEAFRLSFVNCAAVVHTKHFYCPEDTFETNVIGMRSTLAHSVKNGFPTYINCSSSEVYSMRSWREGGVREEDPILLATAEQSLRTSYAVGKLETEFFLRDAVGRGLINGCSVRFANVYSPDEAHEEHIIPYAISSLSRNGTVRLLENAKETYRTFLHNSDSCNAVVSLLETDTPLEGSVFNVGNEEEISILDLIDKISRYLRLEKPIIEFAGCRTADPPRRLLNCQKIRSATGWRPEIGIDEGLKQCIENFRQREAGS